MGAITSRQVTEIQKDDGTMTESQQATTPRNSRILPFDPRSPSENVARTPITISGTGTPNVNGTPSVNPIKALPIDPRSPTNEISRTPLLVEEMTGKKKHQVLKPTKLAEISFKNNAEAAAITKDPRSPTEKVPRTPLEEEIRLKKENPTNAKSLVSDLNERQSHPEKVDLPTDPGIGPNKKLVDGSVDSDRRPLTDLQNRTQSQPTSRTQSNNVEEEFAKNEKFLLSKLEGQDSKTSTDFVENI